MKTKTCSGCKVDKAIDEFHKSSKMKGGVQNNCKVCSNAARRKYNATERGRETLSKNRYSAEQYREWFSANYKTEKGRAKWILRANGRRARVASAPGKVTAQEWVDLCQNYDGKCVSCNEVKTLTMDHVVPLVKGGCHDISNIQPLCRSCNSSKGVQSTDFRLKFAS